MSMLAERKRKQKWSLNPRGKDWAQDANKFGQKMLEKMGWQQGKGLGVKEDGITEHVKVSYKNDSKGMGYKESNNQWTEHETNFSALLESLTGAVCETEVKLNSLEKKSQTSKVRVHYHKFTRGKDLSRYSEKDLANIFGKKSLKTSKKEVQEEAKSEEGVEPKGPQFLLNAGSMHDYFKKKLPSLGKTGGYVVGNNGVLKRDDSESENEVRSSFGFGYKHDNDGEETSGSFRGFGFKTEATPGKDEGVTEKLEEKSKKKRKVDKQEEVSSPKKKKKHESSMGLTNPAFNPMSTPVRVQKHVLNTIQESVLEEHSLMEENSPRIVETKVQIHEQAPKRKNLDGSRNKKNKVKIPEDTIEELNVTEGLTFTAQLEAETCIRFEENPDNKQVKEKKKKKKQRIKETGCIDNPNFDEITEELTELSQAEENPYELKVKKNKKKKKQEAETPCENPTFNDTMDASATPCPPEENPYEVKVKQKKRKKGLAVYESTEKSLQTETTVEDTKLSKKKRKELETRSCKGSVQDAKSKENPYEVKNKEKKKSRREEAYAIQNPLFAADDDSSPPDSENNNAFEVERKTKKSKKAKEEVGIVNLALNLDNLPPEANEEGCDLMLNVVTIPIVTKTSVTNMDSYTITRVNNVKRRKSVRFSDVTQEMIIPNNEALRSMSKNEYRNEVFSIGTQVINNSPGLNEQMLGMSPLDQVSLDDDQPNRGKKLGLDNTAFDKQTAKLEENLDSISKTIDRYQAEIENDINEKKLGAFHMEDMMVGEMGNPHGEPEKLSEGTKLKFKHARFEARTPMYQLDKTGPRKAYKHLIKGDIILKFKQTNLHEVGGYAVRDKPTM